jgi:hypothetical protein
MIPKLNIRFSELGILNKPLIMPINGNRIADSRLYIFHGKGDGIR